MEQSNKNQKNPAKKNKAFPFILGALVILGGWFGISKYTHSLHHEETDDAQIESHLSPVISRVAGYVKEVRAVDNQKVRKGDTLIILDDRDYQLKLDQALAGLATAQSNLQAAKAMSHAAVTGVNSARASIATADAQIETAKVNVWRTSQDLKRYENLLKDHSITQQQYEQALAAKQTADRQLQVLQEQRKQALEQTSSVASQSSATSQQEGVAGSVIKQKDVEVKDAELNLSYTVITAPADGILSRVNIQQGQFLQTGQTLFSVVADEKVWVVANFKETQLEKMKIGQKVSVSVDAYPNHPFDAMITSFSPATGAKFSLLPADNASGNFVKVVQRIPVKIVFDKTDSLANMLKPGMNVLVDVHLD